MILAAFATWLTLATVLEPRQEVAVAAVNGKVYLIGGIGAGLILSSVEEYDPSANSWRFVSPLPRPRHHAAAAVIGPYIYVIGGFESLAFDAQPTVYRYDTRNDEWSEVAPLPSSRAALAAATIDGKIYAVGGVPGSGRELLVYDAGMDRWTPLAPMPTGREHLAAATIGGKLYVAGGRLAGNSNAFERYDPHTNSWHVLPGLPTPRSGLAAAAVGTRIYVFGGEGNFRTPTGVFEENESFDVISGTWRSEVPMANPRHGIGATAIANRIYIPAGAPVQGFGTSDVHDALVIEAPRRRSVRH